MQIKPKVLVCSGLISPFRILRFSSSGWFDWNLNPESISEIQLRTISGPPGPSNVTPCSAPDGR